MPPIRWIPSLLLLIALIGAAPAVGAVRGFGYDDPRSAQIYEANDVAALPGGGFLITQRKRVMMSEDGGPLRVVAGGGGERVGDGSVDAVKADLGYADEVVALPSGGFAVTTSIGLCVVEDGRLTRLVGPEVAADAIGLDIAPDGTLLLTNYLGGSFTTVSPDGQVDHVGHPERPVDADFTADGRIVFMDDTFPGSTVGRVEADGSTTVLAGGKASFSGDGGPAIDAGIKNGEELEVAPDGAIVFAQRRRVRRIDPGGTIDTIAGTGLPTYNGDGIPATEANLFEPRPLAIYPDGQILVGSFPSGRVTQARLRKIDLAGTITTVAGMPAPMECDADPYNGIEGTPEDDRLHGTRLRDTIRGGIGADSVEGRLGTDCLMGGTEDDTITGGAGRDVVDAGDEDDWVDGGDGFDLLIGEDDDDTVIGAAGNDEIYGWSGDDRLIGGAGDDYLAGDTGKDTFAAGRGDDFIEAQYYERERWHGPVDVIHCGPGKDRVRANSYDRVAKDCEILKGAIAKDR